MAEGELQVEATGETVGEAKWSALRELERLNPAVDKSAVRFQVVTEGERGLLGVGYAPARVIATVADAAPPEPGDESEHAALVREIVTRITDGIGIECRIDVEERDDAILATCSGRELGMLIGKHGQTIDAIQYLANAILARRYGNDRKEAIVDAAGYRARRQASLEALAVRSAERVLATGNALELDPMTAVERKVVHVRLKEFAGVRTTSEGTEPNRFVVVHPGDDEE
jgi:spoIIIJ-associated protein